MKLIMNDQEKIDTLKKCFEDVVWMAIRYGHGRHTYATSMVRDSIRDFQKVFPDWEVKEDRTIEPPEEDELNGFNLREDYLNDLFDG